MRDLNTKKISFGITPLEIDFLKESRCFYDGLDRTGCHDGVPSLPRSIVTDHREAKMDLEILSRRSLDVNIKMSRTKDACGF